MQNKSKLSKQKNLRATVSESLPGKSPDLRLQTDRHTCGPDRARGHPGGLGLGDRTKTRHPRESDRPRFLRQPLQAGRGKQKNRLQRPSRHECRAQDETDKTAPSAPEDPCTQNSPERPPHGRQNPLRPRFRARTPGDLRNRVRGKTPDCEKNRIFEHSVLNADTQSI